MITLHEFLDYTERIIIILCGLALGIIICLLLLQIFFFNNKKHEINEIKISIYEDSYGTISKNSQASIDKLISIVKKQDRDIRERYACFIEQKENERILFTSGGVIISVIITLLGFFGYKSFKAIEEKAIRKADENYYKKINPRINEIHKSLDEEIRKRINNKCSDDILNEKIDNILVEKIKEEITPHIESTRIDQRKIDDLINNATSAIQTKISMITNDLQHLEAEIQELKKCISLPPPAPVKTTVPPTLTPTTTPTTTTAQTPTTAQVPTMITQKQTPTLAMPLEKTSSSKERDELNRLKENWSKGNNGGEANPQEQEGDEE